MRKLLTPIADYFSELWRGIRDGWDRFWFTPTDPTTLGVIRFVTGLTMLYAHGTCAGEMMKFLGPDAWMDAQAIEEVRQMPDYYAQSIFYYVTNPTLILILFGVFLTACFTFMIGLFSRTSNIVVWVGHISIVYRGLMIWFGLDTILAMLALYLMFAPSGAAFSVDRLLQRYRLGKMHLRTGRIDAEFYAPTPSWSANVVIRMLQVHMCIIYLCAGLAKLQGPAWWSGYAVWMTMVTHEFVMVDFTWMVYANPPWLAIIVSTIGSAFTILFEVGFTFLIWNRMLRPIFLASAVILHLGIGVIMGLGSFGAAMLAGCMAFVSPAAMSGFLAIVFKGKPVGRFYYNRNDPLSVRQAAWVFAADSWKQVELVEAQGKTLALAGTLHPPEGGSRAGLSAFWRLFRPLRALWIGWPLAIRSFSRAERRDSSHDAAQKGVHVAAGR
jgi:hypothetical protein